MLGKIIKSLIKKNDRLYAIARCIKSNKDPNYQKLVKGYYEVGDCASVLIEHKGEKYPDKFIYHINYFVPHSKKDISKNAGGIAALLRYTLYSLIFPSSLKMIPVVEWGTKSVYHDPGMDSVTLNVFEYYFKPVANICSGEIEDYKNVINVFDINPSLRNSWTVLEQPPDMFAPYCVDQQEIERLADLYKKYIHLNTDTQKYVEEQMNEILDGESILGVHIRGTDFNLGIKDHPIVITAEEYLETVKRVLAEGKYEKVFLATDDANALEIFKEEFKNKLLYYKDTYRSDDYHGVQTTFSNRPLHHYKLGLEALRDIYALANCSSLVCGFSNMSYAARYVNIAINRRFKDIVVLDNGINAKESVEATRYMKMDKYAKEWKKRNIKSNQ